MRRAVLALAVLSCLLASGCGLGAGEGDDGSASMLVTRDFGTRQIGTSSQNPIPGGETVMRMLQRDFDVETRYGGGFVQSINGVAGGREGGQPVDWFYFVNGILAEDGAAAHEVAAGDRIWWDHHEWGSAGETRAVVGAFPEPFVSGVGGKKLPVRLECAEAAEATCDEVADRLGEAGVNAGRSAARSFGGVGLLRIKVGVWADVRDDSALRMLEKGPRVSGVYAQPDAAGREIALYGPDGQVERTIGAGGGLIAATRLGEEAPTWIVTGTDEVGLAAAAAQLQASSLRNRYAIAVEDGRPTALPLQPPPETP